MRRYLFLYIPINKERVVQNQRAIVIEYPSENSKKLPRVVGETYVTIQLPPFKRYTFEMEEAMQKLIDGSQSKK